MSEIEPLKQGQEVFLKRPVQIYAKVVGPREGDLGLPQEQVHYAVQLLPLEQYYLAEDLEPAQRPQPMKSELDDTSSERVAEAAHFHEVAAYFSPGDPFFDLAQEINNLIAGRAYELYEQRGFAHGHDAEDWLKAELEILLNAPADITETETELSIHAEVPGFSENDLELRVAPRALCIAGKRQQALEQTKEGTACIEGRAKRIFRVLELPSEIDPVRVAASVGDGILEVKLPKIGLRKVVPVRAKAASA